MVIRRGISLLLVVLLVAGAAVIARGDGVLDQVPRDAEAFIYLRNWKQFDVKTAEILAPLLGRNPILVTPGVVIQAVVGKDVGLDPEGELLLVAVAGDGADGRRQQFVWLPVIDYDRFAKSLGGKSDEPITVVTISGEDLLCARQGKWALVIDPQQRSRLEAMVAGKTERPASLTAMRDWLVRQDVAAAAFPTEASRKTFRETLAAAAARPAGDGLFAPVREPNPSLLDVFGSTSNLYAVAHDLFTTSPGLSNLAFSAEAVGVGIRLDESLNVLAGLRMSWPKAGPGRESIAKVGPDGTVPVLHREDEFILSGAGALPRPVVVAAMEAYSARMIDDLRRDSPRSKLDQAAIAGFRQACEQAAGEVNSLAVYLPIGAEQEGVSTNQYLAVRASSAEKFVERTAEAMRRWNELNGGAEPSTGIVFDAKHVQLGNRSATQYSLDVVASIGGEDTSEMKRVMERLFGPDRKLHLWVVPVDAQTALLMQGTPQQAAKAVDSLADTSRRIDWNKPNVVRTNALLNSNEAANWKLFFSPQGYVRQQEREEDAAGPGIGRTVRKVDDSPPIGMAAGFGDGSLWIDVSAPVETVKAVYKFTHSRPQ